jgi:hypothetical protein
VATNCSTITSDCRQASINVRGVALLQAEADDEDADVVYLPIPADAVASGSAIRQTFVFGLRLPQTATYAVYKSADKNGYVGVYRGATAALSVAIDPNVASEDIVVDYRATGSTPETVPALIMEVELFADQDYFVVSHLERTQTPTHHSIELRDGNNV